MTDDIEVKSAIQLIQLFNPSDLDAIRMLFLGNLVDLEMFARTVQTFIPKAHTATEVMIDSLTLAIIDLFEELDSDADGKITWQDFISYYSEVNNDSKTQQKEVPQSQKVFKQVCSQTTQSSGKISKVDISSVLPNNAQFNELMGSSILQVHVFNEQYFIVTELGVYQSDSTFMFPKLIFEPSDDTLMGSEKEKRAVKLDKDEKLKKKSIAINDLIKRGFIKDKHSITIQDDEVQDDFELKTDKEILLSMDHDVINQSTSIVDSIILSPLPFLVVATKLPFFLVISLQGTQAISDPFRIPACCTTMYWQSQDSCLYIGMTSGVVNGYKISMSEKQHQFLQMLKQPSVVKKDSLTLLNETLESKSIEKLDAEDLCRIYPEMRLMIGSSLLGSKKNRKEEVDALMKLEPSSLDIPHLLTHKIFNPHSSTLEQHGIKPQDVMREDPKAFVKSRMLPAPSKTAIVEKKHGGIILQIDAELFASEFISNGSVRKISGSYGKFEQIAGESEVFRLIVACGEGSIAVVDESLQTICGFPKLHPEGLVSVYCVNDYITSIGYNTIYQIPPEAIQQAYLGQVIQYEVFDFSEQQSREPQLTINVTDDRLAKGDKYKGQTLIKQIQPPRPGQPILTTFQMGNVIAVIDHEYMITFFHSITGAHLTRMNFSIGRLQGLRFGDCMYNFNRDLAFLPIGKYIFNIRTIANEDVNTTKESWDYLQDVNKEVLKSKGVDITQFEPKIQLLSRLPIGSISRELSQILVNKNLNETAIVTGEYEITFYDLQTGKAKKIIDIDVLSRQLSEDDPLIVPPTEYRAIESGDIANQYVSKSIVAEQDMVVSVNNEQKGRIVKDKDADELLRKERVLKSSLPQFLDPIQKMKLREKTQISLVKIIGDKILSLQTDQKGRVLYVIGTKGVVTLYWKTGCLFDYTCVGVVGKQDEDNKDFLDSLNNPFKFLDGTNSVNQGQTRFENDTVSGGLTCYSLNLDLNQLITRNNIPHKLQNKVIAREQRVVADFSRKLFFMADTINPQECRVITVSTNKEFNSSPTNSRILCSLNIQDCVKEMDSLFKVKQKFLEEYRSKNCFKGLYEGASKYQRTFRFVPKALENLEKVAEAPQQFKHKSPLSVLLQHFIDLEAIEFEATNSQITSIDCSEVLGLLAVGTSDSRVVIYDTISIKFMKQCYISIPQFRERQSISVVKFLGSLPLLLVGISDGSCFIYTTRPVTPSYALLLSFKHSSYSPVSYPVNNDVADLIVRQNRYIASILRYFAEEPRIYSKFASVETDMIKHLYAEHCPDFGHLFINQYENYINKHICDLAFAGQNQQLRGSQDENSVISPRTQSSVGSTASFAPRAQVQTSFSALSNYQTETSKHGLINMPSVIPNELNDRNSISTIPGKTQFESYGNESAIFGSNANLSSVKELTLEQQQAMIQKREQAEQLQVFDYYKLVVKDILSRTNQTTSSAMSSTSLMKNQRQRRLFSKIQGAVTILTITKNVFTDLLLATNQLKVSREVKNEIFKKVDKEEDVDQYIQSNIAVSDKIKQDYSVSVKTQKIINDFKKSRFNVGNRKEPEYNDVMALTPYDVADIEAESLGVVYKYEQNESGTVKVPMRQICLETSRCNVPITCCYYDQERKLLMIGDSQGYISAYSLENLLQQVPLVQAEIRKKQCYDEKTKRHYEQILGFVDQKIDPRILKQQLENGHISPILNSKVLRIVYQFRAHGEAVQSLESLPSNSNGQIITCGEDRRLFVWDLLTGSLLGNCQRVQLDQPPEFWERLFKEPLVQNQTSTSQVKQKKQSKLQLEDLKTNIQQLVPPPLRVELPPPAEYPWDYRPQTIFSKQGSTLSSSALSLQDNDNVINSTRNIISQRQTIPTLDSNTSSNLLKSTGLNPSLYQQHKSSWTVRAALRKASNYKMDGSEHNASVLLAEQYIGLKVDKAFDETSEISNDNMK